jgi:hypothetical protein
MTVPAWRFAFCWLGCVRRVSSHFTLLFVVRSESLVLEKAAEMAMATQRVDRKPGEGKTPSSAARTRDLIREWARLNYMRTLFPLIGALVSYSAC